MDDLYMRLAKAEAMAEAQKAELEETLQNAYEAACRSQNKKEAAALARKIRDKLLTESDSRMCFDRLGLVVPSGTTFSSWLAFLRGLGSSITGEWARYRKALRDLPEQEGFPFNIDFPEKPEGGKKEGENDG